MKLIQMLNQSQRTLSSTWPERAVEERFAKILFLAKGAAAGLVLAILSGLLSLLKEQRTRGDLKLL